MPTRQDRNTFNDLCFVMIKVKFSSFLKNRDSYKTVVATLFVWWAEKLPPKSSGAQKCVQNNLADKLLRTISTLIMYLFIKCCIIFNNVKMMLLKKNVYRALENVSAGIYCPPGSGFGHPCYKH